MKILAEFFLKGPYYLFTSKHHRKFFWLCLKFIGKKRFVDFSATLFAKEIIGPDYLSFLWQYYEIFCLNSYAFETQNEKPLIIDCGSNIGLSLLYYSKNYPNARVLSYEPSSSIYSYLQKNKRTQSINAELKNKAIWKENGELFFNDQGADFGKIENKGEPIQALRLKDILTGESEVDFLKMDIEGAEVEVLLDCGNSLRVVQALFIEYHSFSDGAQELDKVLSLLTAHGFRYDLQVPNPKPQPLMRIGSKKNQMDLQVNIWARRLSK